MYTSEKLDPINTAQEISLVIKFQTNLLPFYYNIVRHKINKGKDGITTRTCLVGLVEQMGKRQGAQVKWNLRHTSDV